MTFNGQDLWRLSIKISVYILRFDFFNLGPTCVLDEKIRIILPNETMPQKNYLLGSYFHVNLTTIDHSAGPFLLAFKSAGRKMIKLSRKSTC